VDEGRKALVCHLSAIADVVSADRVATLWVDEYGPRIPHPHAVVDLLSDRPRRAFGRDPLWTARSNGVPGVHEYGGGGGLPGVGGGWGLVVSLGSDGTRSWFLVADSVTPRPSLSADQRGAVMFLAGECSALVLHPDVHGSGSRASSPAPSAGASATDERRFPGWQILRDLEGRDEEGVEAQRIALRFVVARLPMLYLEEGLAVPRDRRRDQVERAREELLLRGAGQPSHEEAELWEGILDAFEEGDAEALGRRLLALGLAVESQGHRHGAGELFTTAYGVAAAVGAVPTAVEAARKAGRAERHRGRWAQAHRWYEVARGVAAAAERMDDVALILEGVGATHRERGNLPAARSSLEEALAVAESSGNGLALGRVHHGFLGLEQAAGNLDAAARHGWRAVSLYGDDENRTRGLAGLAALFQEMGRLEAAEDAWLLVRHLSGEEYYTLYAVDALSHLAALRGDGATFARLAAESDALGWDSGPLGAKADILLHRGLSYQALRRTGEARRWLERTVAFAEECGFSRVLFEAESTLQRLDSAITPESLEREAPPAASTEEVEAGLHAMRRELVGAPA
jgi:tetratricopeptide (TPR) repeat protein